MGKLKKKEKLTDFEKEVLGCVLNIPFGQLRTYKWIAKKIGKPKAWQAIGKALNKNPFPLIIPCHRVIKTGGHLGGYSLGKRLKKKLINLEKNIKDMVK